MTKDVTLHISMAPQDVRHVKEILPHQLRALAGQVDHIQFTVDAHHSGTAHYSTDGHEQKLSELLHFLNQVCAELPRAEIVHVDYSELALRGVGQAFLGKDFVPKKAWNGGPFYPYLYGLFRCRHNYVFHTDSDMFYGGGSQNWIVEAVELLDSQKDVLICSPLPGPPTHDGRLVSQVAVWSDRDSFMHRFRGNSSRVFLIDRRRLMFGQYKVPLLRANARETLQAFLTGMFPYLNLEDSISSLMRDESLSRIDFLGSGGGLWSLHPPYRSERFYLELPMIISRIESNDIPEAQRGDDTLNDSLIDWSDARRQRAILHRLTRLFRVVRANAPNRFRQLRQKSLKF